jgi:hypothetical protein
MKILDLCFALLIRAGAIAFALSLLLGATLLSPEATRIAVLTNLAVFAIATFFVSRGDRYVCTFVIALTVGFFFVNEVEIGKQQARAEEARLENLKANDPQKYLEELKTKDPQRWKAAFAEIDKEGYAKFVKEKEELARKERQVKIDALLARLKTTSPKDIVAQKDIYDELQHLDPANKSYNEKWYSFAQAVWKTEDQQKSPWKFVSIQKWSWTKGGFDTVMIADFAIKNELPWPVKDITIRCTYNAPSGSQLGSLSNTIYERIESHKTKHVNRVNMGFIHTQAKGASCSVIGAVSIH